MSLGMADNYLDVQEIDFQDPEDESYRVSSTPLKWKLGSPIFPDDEDDNVMGAMEKMETEIYAVKAEDLTHAFLYNMFLSMDVHVDDRMIEKVLVCANRMAHSDRYRNPKVRRMQVKTDMFVNDPWLSSTEKKAG